MICRVMRPFGGPDNTTLAVGSVIDVSDWPQKNVFSLIQRRYLEELEHETVYTEASVSPPPKRGRRPADTPAQEEVGHGV